MNKNSEAFRYEDNVTEPIERQWLLEEALERRFHYADNISYKTFLDYLRYLRDAESFCWQKFQIYSVSKVIYGLARFQYVCWYVRSYVQEIFCHLQWASFNYLFNPLGRLYLSSVET